MSKIIGMFRARTLNMYYLCKEGKSTFMEKIKKRLIKLSEDVLRFDADGDTRDSLLAQLDLLQELSRTWKMYESFEGSMPAHVKQKLDALTTLALKLNHAPVEDVAAVTEGVKTLSSVIKTFTGFEKVDVILDEDMAARSEDRRSSKEWDKGGLVTAIKLTEKQRQAMVYLDDDMHDRVLLLGGSGSGKSFIQAYKMIRDALRYRAPVLIARDKLIDLTQGMIDQIVPAILALIAKQNGVDDWKTWTIDGLKFAKWTDKRTKLEFATGGYVRFAGLSIRDLSESGSDKILSPSWLHVMLEEVSELEYGIVEKIITRLRHNVEGVLNKLMLCENPPSINHWSYKRFFEKKRTDGSSLSEEETSQHVYLLMNPGDNKENLSEKYIRNLSQFTGANYERFYLGKFQDMEEGEIFKSIQWTDKIPKAHDWDRLCIYTDPTPLITREHHADADYKASVLCGLWNGEIYVLEVRAIRGSTMDMLVNIKQLWDESPDQSRTEVWMEKKQVPTDFKQVWTMFAARTNWHVPIQMDTRHFGEKKAAIETILQPMFANGTIFFNEKFRNTERGLQTMHQVLKFSRKKNKNVHDDIPDAIMRAASRLMGNKRHIKKFNNEVWVGLVRPKFIQTF